MKKLKKTLEKKGLEIQRKGSPLQKLDSLWWIRKLISKIKK